MSCYQFMCMLKKKTGQLHRKEEAVLAFKSCHVFVCNVLSRHDML